MRLAKRTRPETLPATHFLSTRVQNPTEEDATKAHRCLKRLNGAMELGLRLNATSPIGVISYIDAAHGAHMNAKSRLGASHAIGAGAIEAASSTIGVSTKSACESEHVALSEQVANSTRLRSFLMGQGHHQQPATVMQDDESAIKLAESGLSSASRARRINIRRFFVKDRVANGEIKVEYCPTKSMIADVLTKPSQGQLLLELRDLSLGYVQA